MPASEIVASPPARPDDNGTSPRLAPAREVRLSLLALLALTALGAIPRVIVAHQSLFADELSTYWISVTHSLGGVLSLLYSSGRIKHAEITPPLSFVASWLATRLGNSPELLRLPALLAGTATIPAVYALGVRSIGRRGALLAAAVTAFSPFMIYYSAEARAYGLMMFLVACAVLCLLAALDSGRWRYWVLYGVFSAASFYTHYTCVFVLATALIWVLWYEPWARRRAIVANIGAAVLVVPWIPGLLADLRSPTLTILSDLSPFTPYWVRIDIQHWAIGFPYTVAGGLSKLPGVPALLLLAVVALLAVIGLVDRARRESWATAWHDPTRVLAPGYSHRRLVLVCALMMATPVGEVIGSAIGNHIIGVRDLAASWPFLALTGAAVVTAAGPRLGTAAAALAVLAFALSVPKVLEAHFQRPDYQGAADYVAANARHGDVVIDVTGTISPGPVTGFDVAFRRRLPVFRGDSRQERDHPFTLFDPVTSIPTAVSEAVRSAHGGRVFVVTPLSRTIKFPAGYRLSAERTYAGFDPTYVYVYSRAPAAAP
jgi:hypothetical protein